MSGARKFLTKSKFTASYSCPRKLYYTNNPETYANNNTDDAFLRALAEGGFQVGALAQQYYAPGHLIDTLDKQQALDQTNALLQQHTVTIFEAAFQYKNLFVRADIVRKKGNHLELIEVKAKSFDSSDPDGFRIWDKRAYQKGKYKLLSNYESYVLDVAFQTWVLQHAQPALTTRSFLCMADTSKTATVDGLNQLFKLTRAPNGRNEVKVQAGAYTAQQLGERILTAIELTDDIKHIINDVTFDYGPTFRELVHGLAELAELGKPGPAAHSSACKSCEFRAPDARPPLKNGFDECWGEKLPAKDLGKPMVFDIWNFRAAQKLIDQGVPPPAPRPSSP